MFNNYKLWDVWDERVAKCREDKLNIVDPGDFRLLCSQHKNSGTRIFTLENSTYSRCNIFNCPMGGLK